MIFRILTRLSIYLLITAFLLTLSRGAVAQELADFLACADFTDRVERVLCLESVLEQAVTEAEVSTIPEQAPAVAEADSVGQDENVASVSDSDNETASGFRLPVIGGLFSRNRSAADAEEVALTEEAPSAGEEPSTEVAEFGRQARVVEGEEGVQVLVDVITDLKKVRPDIWQVTLASGQVWRQMHVKRFNLREGESVRIYPTGWGENFRLETDRLSGFIQVGRID